MALYVLGDTHLSLGASKPMDVFPGWNGYVERLERNWRKLIKPGYSFHLFFGQAHFIKFHLITVTFQYHTIHLNGMTGVSKTLSGSSILSSPVI